MGFAKLQAGLTGLLVALLVQRVAAVSSVDITYCASINTASMAANTSIYQSDGLCHDFCVDSYAYAIVNDQSCWCSDYTPDESVQVSSSECSMSCPGYPSDLCGGDGVYGYMALDKAAVGTKGGTSSTKAATTSSATKAATTTTTPTTTSTSTPTTPTTSTTPTPTTTSTEEPSSSQQHTTAIVVPATSSSDTTQDTTTSSSSSTTSSAQLTLLVQTVTQGGTVQTVTATPSASAVATAKKSLSTGAAVGIAIAVIAVAAIAAIAAFLVWRRKRKQRETEEALFPTGDSKAPSPRGSSPSATNISKMTETSSTPAFARHGGGGSWETDQSGRRRSALMPIDPRIDPGFSDIYSRNDNKSRDSINSLRDDHDYSRRVHQPNRVLRATNPDPDDE